MKRNWIEWAALLTRLWTVQKPMRLRAHTDEVREEHRRLWKSKRASASRALAKKVGTVQTVLIDEVDEDGAIARSTAAMRLKLMD